MCAVVLGGRVANVVECAGEGATGPDARPMPSFLHGQEVVTQLLLGHAVEQVVGERSEVSKVVVAAAHVCVERGWLERGRDFCWSGTTSGRARARSPTFYVNIPAILHRSEVDRLLLGALVVDLSVSGVEIVHDLLELLDPTQHPSGRATLEQCPRRQVVEQDAVSNPRAT